MLNKRLRMGSDGGGLSAGFYAITPDNPKTTRRVFGTSLVMRSQDFAILVTPALLGSAHG